MTPKALAGCLTIALMTANAAYGSIRDTGRETGSISIITFKTHSRLQFRLDEGVMAVWKENPAGFELFFKGVGFADFGAPAGVEREWMRRYDDIKDSRLESLKFSEVAGGIVVYGKWRFPGGDDAPADPRMDKFDYHEKNPPRYVVDFWLKPGPTVAEIRAAKKKAEILARKRMVEEAAKKRKGRRIASVMAKARADDITRFCREPLSEKNDVILPFLPLHLPVEFKKWFPFTTADTEYIYLEPKSTAKDAQYARLALSLYRQGKPALVIRTLDFLDDEFPNSPHVREMRFLRANAMIKMGFHEPAMRILKDIAASEKEAGVALHATMYLAARAAAAGSYLQSLESFLWLINNYPSHRLAWAFHLGAAEALYSVKQTDRAAKEYQWVIMNAPDRKIRADAASRLGDLYLSRLQYERAIGSYAQAMSYFKDDIKRFPAFFINRAEVIYWLGDYDRASDAFRAFLNDYPSNPAGWRATLRLGEIHARRSGEASQAEARKWYYETANRFPFSRGTTLARMRLIPCGDHGGFDLDGVEKFFENEAAKFEDGDEVVTRHYNDLRALTRVRALVTMSGEEKAVSIAVGEMQRLGRTEVRGLVTEVFGLLFRKTVLGILERGKKFEALVFYADKAPLLEKKNGIPYSGEADYLLKLSQAASDLGLGAKAKELAVLYEKTRAYENQNRSVASGPADAEEQKESIAEVEKSFTQAMALWISEGSAAETKIREMLAPVRDEYEFSYEKEIILGLLDEKAGKPASALSHALKAELLAPPHARHPLCDDAMRISFWIGSLQARAGSTRMAVELFNALSAKLLAKDGNTGKQKCVAKAAALGLPAVPSAEYLVMTEGELLARQGKWGESAATYGRAVTNGLGGNHALYRYADALEKTGGTGEAQKAGKAMRSLASSKTDDFWRKLAREALGPEFKDGAKEGPK